MTNTLHIAYSLSESSAATRLAESMEENEEYKSYFLLGKRSDYAFVRERQLIPYLSNFWGITYHVLNIIASKLFLNHRNEVFSFDFYTYPFSPLMSHYLNKNDIKIIFVHWGGYGFFPLKLLKNFNFLKTKKIYIVAHDYNAVTGGCHIPMDCSFYSKNCEKCPMMKYSALKKIIKSRSLFNKNLILKNNLKVLAPSSFTKLFIQQKIPRTFHLANIISDNYKIQEKEAFENWNSKERGVKKLLFIGSKNSERDNKGNELLKESLIHLARKGGSYTIITVGDKFDFEIENIHQTHYKNLDTPELIELYKNANLTLVPSRYETFSQVCLESIFCYTPVIAFDKTGPRDIIIEGETGFLVESFNAIMFAKKIDERIDFKHTNWEALRNGVGKTKRIFSKQKTLNELKFIINNEN